MAKYDIHFQLLPEEEQLYGNGKIFSFGYTSAIGVKGPQKLVNRWIKCLLTLKGSDLLRPAYGTGFSNLWGSNISNQRDFSDAIILFVEDCNAQMRALDNRQGPPANERLASAVVTAIIPRNGDGFDVYVTLKNTAGELISLLLPTDTTRS